MRALLRGERRGSVVTVLAMVGLLCLLGSSLGLTLAYRAQLKDFKATIYTRCLQRQAYDRSNHASVVADVQLYTEILRLSQDVPLPTDPQQRALSVRYREVIEAALASKQKAADQGVIGTCAAYR